jgi:hypothetical protein
MVPVLIFQMETRLLPNHCLATGLQRFSEENIQKILDGTYRLPQQLRVAIMRLEPSAQWKRYRSDEQFLKTQQSYLDLFSDKFRQSSSVKKLRLYQTFLSPNRRHSQISGKPL